MFIIDVRSTAADPELITRIMATAGLLTWWLGTIPASPMLIS